MNPYVVSAQFAAYVWYEHENPGKSEQEAASFARRNWVSFLPCANKGVGKLLTKIASHAGAESEIHGPRPSEIPGRHRPENR